jgi:hypothetical protein
MCLAISRLGEDAPRHQLMGHAETLLKEEI